MAAAAGKNVLLKADTAAGSPQSYTTIAGLRTNTWTVNGEDVDVTTKDDNGWQQRLSGAGVRSISIAATGVFQDSAIEETVRGWAFDQTINWFQMTLPNGDDFEFQAQISNYERGGDHDNAETFSMTMNSHGEPKYHVA
jgi:TP901-1 family phage major tail protein